MKVLVTGSSGHLGEALMRVLRLDPGLHAVGLDINASPFTDVVGSITDPKCVSACMEGVGVVYHTATLHKPHVATHSKQNFINTNISGTLNLLEAAVAAGVSSFVFTSATSVFGDAMRPDPGQPAAWVTENTKPIPRNIYGVTKTAAEDLCHLFHRKHGLNCIILRTSRFFPEEDDDPIWRESFTDANLKAIEFLYRRAEIEDVVNAHLKAAAKAPELRFGRYIVSATTPFRHEDMLELNSNAVDVVRRRIPQYQEIFDAIGWRMLDRIDRVYFNEAARTDLGWIPEYDFIRVLQQYLASHDISSPLAAAIGAKGYDNETYSDGPYPVRGELT